MLEKFIMTDIILGMDEISLLIEDKVMAGITRS